MIRPPAQVSPLSRHLSTPGKGARAAIHRCDQQRAPKPHFCRASLSVIQADGLPTGAVGDAGSRGLEA